jgi:hypothetical protein
MKVARKIKNPTIEEQIKNLKRRVYLQHPDFLYKEGILIGVEVKKKYWVYLDKTYQKQDGNWSRKKEFNKEYIRLV